MKYFSILTIAILALAITGHSFAADFDQGRYERVKKETMHSGSAGFDRRHRAYSRHIMNRNATRIDDAGIAARLQDIAPAAGDAKEDKPAKMPTYND